MIAIGGRSNLSETSEAIKKAASSAGRPEPKVLELRLDVTSRESVDGAAAQIRKEFGRIDIVVNNAGLFMGRGLVADTDPEAWWDTMTVNLKGPYLVMRALLPLMLETGADGLKTFVTVASVGALLRTPSASAYQTSKMAALRLTEFLNSEYSDKGVIAFSIHPGNILTDMTADPGAPLPDYLVPGEFYPHLLCKTPFGYEKKMAKLLTIYRFAVFVDTVELAGDSIVYLTAKRREWLGGRYVNLTWDLPELMGKEEEIVKNDKLKVQLVL